jgi:hypothetical protein
MSPNARLAWRWAAVLFVLLALSAAGLAALLVWVLPQHVGSISINGEELVLGPATSAHWFVAWLLLLAALLALLLIVPLALLFGVALPLALAAVGVLLGTLFAALVIALRCAPLLVGGWLVWRATRGGKTAPATIEP